MQNAASSGAVGSASPPVSPAPARAIRPRSPDLGFDDTIPRHWFGGSAVATQLANGVNLLFPAGERFFVRSVRHFLRRIEDDPALVEQVKGFFGQEGRHAREHERFFEIMEAQGYRTKAFVETFEKLSFTFLERIAPPELRLSATAAAEHFTAIMAENALREDIFAAAHPAMKKLLCWHAAEEIEHKSVAFDVLQRVAPSYALRMAGLAVSTSVLATFWIAAAIMLLRQDGISLVDAMGEMKKLGPKQPFGKRVFGRGIREYIRRDFHPSQNDNYELARAYLAGAAMT